MGDGVEVRAGVKRKQAQAYALWVREMWRQAEADVARFKSELHAAHVELRDYQKRLDEVDEQLILVNERAARAEAELRLREQSQMSRDDELAHRDPFHRGIQPS